MKRSQAHTVLRKWGCTFGKFVAAGEWCMLDAHGNRVKLERKLKIVSHDQQHDLDIRGAVCN